MKRVLCIWIPNWPVERLVGERPELDGQPLVLHEPRRGAARVVARSAEGAALGIAVGMSLAEAEALAGPSLRYVEPYDPVADRAALVALAAGCRQFSPVVGLEESAAPESLLLDVTGVARWFGGEECLARRVLDDFTRRRLDVRLAIADTLAAAWAAARFRDQGLGVRGRIDSLSLWERAGVRVVESTGKGKSLTLSQRERGLDSPSATTHSPTTDNRQPTTDNSSLAPGPWPLTPGPTTDPWPLTPGPCCIIPPGGTRAAVGRLPIEALRLSENTVDVLHQLGIFEIGSLEALPRSALSSRFGPELLKRLAQLEGRAEETICSCPVEPELVAARSLEYPTTRREIVQLLLEQLVHQLAEKLRLHGRGVLRLECAVEMEGKPDAPARITVGLFQATVSAKHLFELAWMQLERVSFPSPVTAMRVEAAATAPLEYRQREMFADGASARSSELAGLIDRLSGRLGRRAVLRLRLARDAQPELAYRYESLVDDAGRRRRRDLAPEGIPPRPLRLAKRPIALPLASLVPEGPPLGFEFGGHHRVAHVWGPERIETGWWRGQSVGRDYYRVETASGRRFWLFRRLRDGRWFLHGSF
ncbi:MAG: DNA polymerase Y family protein [Planctomycetia bacterium]|nr:DNA polymerase Y family protein [Planctomycetia bacterium]